jgi:hypothetical protein
MNFKLKALVAALALAVTLPASAAIDNGTTGAGSLVLTVFDRTASISATFDLGATKATFNQAANSAWDLTTGNYASAWSTFWTSATAANTEWAIFAGDTTGQLAGDKSIFTTVSSTWTNVQNNPLSAMSNAFDTYIFAANNLGNHFVVADGANTATSGVAYGGSVYSTGGQINVKGGDMTASIGTNMNVWNVAAGTSALANSTATKLSVAGFNPYFNLSSTGALNYTAAAAVAAVPEADTSAMMLAGLGLMGFIARRRRNGNAA